MTTSLIAPTKPDAFDALEVTLSAVVGCVVACLELTL